MAMARHAPSSYKRAYLITRNAVEALRERLAAAKITEWNSWDDNRLGDKLDQAVDTGEDAGKIEKFEDDQGIGWLVDIEEGFENPMFAVLREQRRVKGSDAPELAVITVMDATFVSKLKAQGAWGKQPTVGDALAASPAFANVKAAVAASAVRVVKPVSQPVAKSPPVTPVTPAAAPPTEVPASPVPTTSAVGLSWIEATPGGTVRRFMRYSEPEAAAAYAALIARPDVTELEAWKKFVPKVSVSFG